jgi:type VI secretion system protein ImpI
MVLTLRIENYDTLDGGGPLWFSLAGDRASVGRAPGMDWVLPDPARHISSHHFNITCVDGGYWITDVSTNGTFVQGQSHRLQGPHRLRHGDRLLVGHYVIGVQVAQGSHPFDPHAGQPPQPAWGAPPAVADDTDPWEFGGVPVAPAIPMPQGPAVTPLQGMGSDFIALQMPGPHAGVGPGAGLYAAALQQVPRPPQAVAHPAPPPALQMPDLADQPGLRPVPVPPTPQSVWAAQPPAPAMPGRPLAPADQAAPEAIVAAFCAGAGLSPAAAQGVQAEALAHLLGQVIRISTEEIMRMLHDRASVKRFTKGGERTMRSAAGNNPMKFLPDAEQAIEAMFLRPRDGFMTGPEGYRNALKDLGAHQQAVFAALQPALASVLEGMAPEQIEGAEVAGNLLGGSRKAKSWDLYVKRWQDKENTGEHGMLDVFLKAFANAYAQANARSD